MSGHYTRELLHRLAAPPVLTIGTDVWLEDEDPETRDVLLDYLECGHVTIAKAFDDPVEAIECADCAFAASIKGRRARWA